MRIKMRSKVISFGMCECCGCRAIVRKIYIVKRRSCVDIPFQFADYFDDDRNIAQVCTPCEDGIKTFNVAALKQLNKKKSKKYDDWLNFIEMLVLLMRMKKHRTAIFCLRSEVDEENRRLSSEASVG